MNDSNTIEVVFNLNKEDENYSDILISFLSDFGFDNFWEDGNDLKAYIDKGSYDENKLQNYLLQQLDNNAPKFSTSELANIDWNEEWEKNYTPVAIDNKIYVYAPFHEEKKNFEYSILIEPKMSFGTAKHQTTSNILRLLYETNLQDKDVIDAGTGTGILAIFASMKGAKEIFAYDNDIWSVNNSKENIKHNNIKNIAIAQGEAEVLKDKTCDIFIANIHKNVIIKELKSYAQTINHGGKLFLSGFYLNDLDDITAECTKHGLTFEKHLETDNWTAAVFYKK